ncbi:hypothetical protein Tco_0547232, partial [Tanacetum coccineum]
GWKRVPVSSLSRGVDDYHTKAARAPLMYSRRADRPGTRKLPNPSPMPSEKDRGWRSSRHSNRRAPRNAKGRKVRSKIR